MDARTPSRTRVLLAALVAGSVLLLPAAPTGAQEPAPPPAPATEPAPELEPEPAPAPEAEVAGEVERADDPVPGTYIVTLADVSADPSDLVAPVDGEVTNVYTEVLDGFAATMDEAAALALSTDPRVATVAESGRLRLAATPWGLDRVDQVDLPLDGAPYAPGATGAGVDIYVLDGGLRATHQEFAGRVEVGPDFVDGSGTDCNGHGTSVTGVAAGATFGVAPGATLVPVRVADCLGNITTVRLIAALDWVVANRSGPSVVNMSFSGGATTEAERQAVRAATASGVVLVGSAGNGDPLFNRAWDACRDFPGALSDILTVGATTIGDAEASFSNYGTCVDLLAPGVDVPSATRSGDATSSTFTGTSYSAPMVAGAAALYLEDVPGASPAMVRQALLSGATPGRISTNPEGATPNLLLNTPSLAQGAALTILHRSGTSEDVTYTCAGPPSCRDFSLDDDDDPTLLDGTVLANLEPGTYTVTQAPDGPSTLTDVTCDGAVADLEAGSVTFTVTDDEQAACTFTSSASATITIVQDTWRRQDPDDFAYEVCAVDGVGACQQLALDDDELGFPDATLPAVATVAVAVGTTTVTQAASDGWDLVGLTCDGDAEIDRPGRRATVTLASDEQVTCTFSNRRTPPPNDDLADAQVLTGDPVTGTIFATSYEEGEYNASPFGGSVWYRWTAVETGLADIAVCATPTNARVEVFTGTSIGDLNLVPRGPIGGCSGGNRWPIAATAGTTYLVRVSGDSFALREFTLTTPPGVGPDAPVITPGIGGVVEGDTGEVTVSIPVSLSEPSTRTVTVEVAPLVDTARGIATEGDDFVGGAGTVTFAPGDTTETVELTVLGDTIDEPDLLYGEWAIVLFSDPTNATVDPAFYGMGLGVIVDDDPMPTITPGIGGVVEGDEGTTVVQVPVTLSNPSAETVTVEYATVDGLVGTGVATTSVDHEPAAGTVTFAPGETTAMVEVVVRGDLEVEQPLLYGEWVLVAFTGATNATIDLSFYGLGLGIIIDDDGLPGD